MSWSFYEERDYAFGQAMLTLRIHIGVTQTGLAERLGITRKAINRWEAGDTYPKVSHLKALLAFALEQRVFPAGREAEEIRALWQMAHQKVLIDESWLQDLLSQQALPLMPVSVEQTRDLGAVSNTSAGGEREWIGATRWMCPPLGTRGGTGPAFPLGGRGAMSDGECAGHGQHRQVSLGNKGDAPSSRALRGSYLAFPTRCSRMFRAAG